MCSWSTPSKIHVVCATDYEEDVRQDGQRKANHRRSDRSSLARKAEAGYEIEDTDRLERLCRLAKRLGCADGLDRDVLERVEELTGDEQRS